MSRFAARSARFTALLPVAFLALLLFPALSPEALLTRRDAFFLYLPLKQFFWEQVHAGRLATWYPYDGLGVSYVGFSIAGVFHPLTLLYLALQPDQGLKWQALLSYPIAALGAFRLARRLGAPRAGQVLAAIAFSASGYLLSVSNNLPYLLTAAALPWTLLAAERTARRPGPRSACLLALSLLLALVGGDIQGLIVQAAASGAVVVLGRKKRLAARLGALGGAGGLAALAALPQLLPTWVSFHQSARGAGLSLGAATRWFVHPLRLIELAIGPLLPPSLVTAADPVNDLLGGANGAVWAHAELVGLPVCALALAALLRPLPRRLKVHAVIAAAALLLALGRMGGLYIAFHRLVPFWSAFRYPEKLMPYAVLGLALLAGWGARRLIRGDRRARWLFVAGLAGLVALAVCASPHHVGAWLSARLKPEDLPDANAISARLRGAVVLALALLGALVLLSVRGGRRAGWLAVLLNAGQVLALSSWVVAVGPRGEWLAKTSLLKPAAAEQIARGAARLCWDLNENDYLHPPATSAELRMLDATVRSLGLLSATDAGIGTALAYGPAGDGFFGQSCERELKCPSACARVAGAGVGVVDRAQFDAMDPEKRAQLERVADIDDPRAVLFFDSHARRFASLAAARHLPAERARAAIFAPAREPRDEAILIGEGPDLPAAQGSLTARRPAPDRVEADVDLATEGLVVFAFACERGWRARVDGAPAELERADGSLCALMIPAGRHQIELDYRPTAWPWAFAGPLLALLASGFSFRPRRKPATPLGESPAS